MQEIEFIADSVKVTGPTVDGGFSITFKIGEYEQLKAAGLLLIPQNTAIKVKVEQEPQ